MLKPSKNIKKNKNQIIIINKLHHDLKHDFIISVFDSVVAGAFEITFRAKMYVNDFFYFLKIIFDISTSKRSKIYKPYSILIKKKFKTFRNAAAAAFQHSHND